MTDLEFEEEADVEIVVKGRWDDDDNAGKNLENKNIESMKEEKYGLYWT